MWQVVLHVTPLTTALALGVALLIAAAAQWAGRKQPRLIGNCAVAATAAWVALVLAVTLSDGGGTGSRHIGWGDGVETLLDGSGGRASDSERSMVVRQWTANALMFVPLPPLTSLATRRRLPGLGLLALGAALSATIEFLQWLGLTGRVVDLEDVFFNTLGCGVGVGVNALALSVAWAVERRPDVSGGRR